MTTRVNANLKAVTRPSAGHDKARRIPRPWFILANFVQKFGQRLKNEGTREQELQSSQLFQDKLLRNTIATWQKM